MRGTAAMLALALLVPATAFGHEVLHDVERGRAIALKAYFADGEVLAYTQYEVYSPTDRDIPYQKGRTDRSGWLAFVPDAPGKWRVKVADSTGHGLDVEVDAAAAAATSATTAPPPSTAAFVLRPLVGVAVIVVVFGALFALHRRNRTTP